MKELGPEPMEVDFVLSGSPTYSMKWVGGNEAFQSDGESD